MNLTPSVSSRVWRKYRGKKRIDLSTRMPSELIIKELDELQAGKGVWRG